MGLFDFLGGVDPSTQQSAQPSQGSGLIDMLGGALAGGNGAINPQLAAQLGIDPGALKHQAAVNALSAFGQSMLQGSTSNFGRPSFAAAMGNALGAAQGAPNPAAAAIQQGLASRQLKKEDTADQLQQQKIDQVKQMGQYLQTMQLPPEMEPMRNLLSSLPPDQVVKMLDDHANNLQKDKHDQAASDRQMAHDTAIEQMRSAAQIRAAQLAQPKDPLGLGAIQAFGKAHGWSDDQISSVASNHIAPGLDKAGPASPADRADANATAKRQGVLQDTITKSQNLSDRLDALLQGVQGGDFQTGDQGPLGGLTRFANARLPPSMRSDQINEFDKNTNDLVTQYLASATSGGTRGSVPLLRQIQASKPGVEQSTATNLKILQDMKSDLQERLARATAENDHYAAGGTMRSWQPQNSPAASPPAGATPAGAAPAAAVAHLLQHPEMAAAFDAKYGAGAAQRALGQ